MNTEVDFNRYLELLRPHCPQVQAMLVFKPGGDLFWHSDGLEKSTLKAMDSQVGSYCRNRRPVLGEQDLYQISTDKFHLELNHFCDRYQQESILLAYQIDKTVEQGDLPVAENATAALLTQGLVKEYQQQIMIDCKEEELDAMTAELTRRYEELNLVYQTDDQTQNLYHGDALLSQLVNHALGFLEVDLVHLSLPEKNVNVHKYVDEQVTDDLYGLFNGLKEEVFPLLQKENYPVVINNDSDAVQYGVCQGMVYKCVSCAIVNADNRVIGLISIVNRNFRTDFTNSDRNLLEVLARKASKIVQFNFDPLTGLENSHSFVLIIKEALRRSWKSDVRHAIANIDIDHMAIINDISGLEAGDELIKMVGEKISAMLRTGDVVSRLGSDKFGVYLENCDLATAQTVLTKIAAQIAELKLEWEDHVHDISVSIGIAPITPSSKSVTSLLNAAESARDSSKVQGPGKIQVFDEGNSELLQRQQSIRWVSRIQSALREDQFVLYSQLIQPINPERDVPHFEILVRMIDTDGSILSPSNFMPAAESFFLMPQIDRWIINRSFSQLSQWTANPGNSDIKVSINLAGQSLSDAEDLEMYIRRKLDKYDIDPASICFEVTESSAIASITEAQGFIERIRALGCTFALDDFGTGLSSFAYLRDLNVDYLKIDGAFVKDMVSDSISASMVAAIHQVGHSMQMKTVAEYVEDMDIYNKLADIGVDFAQGYALGKPQRFDQQLLDLIQLSRAE